MKKTLEHALLGVDDLARNTREVFSRLRDTENGLGDAYDHIDQAIDLIEEIVDEEMSDRLAAALAEALDMGEEIKQFTANMSRTCEKIRHEISVARKA